METPKKRRRRTAKKYERTNYFISDDDKMEIYNLYNLGWHPEAIGSALNISDKTVYKHCKDMFSPVGGWRRGFVGSAEERSIRLAVRKGESLASVCTKFKRPMWVIWPLIAPSSGLGAIGPKDDPVTVMTTHEYIERIGPDRSVPLGQRLKSFIGRMFGGSS